MNNVNVETVEKFVSEIQRDPGQARKVKRLSGSWVFEPGKPQFVSTIKYAEGSIELSAELPPFSGGWGTSPDPVQYCLYGLAACYAATFAMTATSEGVKLTRLDVTVENWMDLRKQMGVAAENIIDKVKLTVHAEGASRDELERIATLAEERCPGTECVTRAVPLDVELCS